MAKILNKILIILILVITLLNMFSSTIFAAIEIDISKVLLKKIGEADYHLKYYREDDKEYRYLICSIVGYYNEDGEFNPSYCMNKDLTGAEDTPYNVTIDSLLDNNKVWRVIKNGYPYKSAKELGLTSDYDAYAVTKFAVYCVLGESKLENYKAESDDKEAVAMLKALKKLVKIGEEGTEKQDDNPLSINKIGNFTNEDKYYSQQYKVTSTAEFNNYKISSTKGIPEGGYVADLEGNKKTTFNNGENFKIMIPKTKLSEDIDVKINIEAECESYVILYGKTTVTNTQNYVVTAGEYATANTSTDLNISTNTGKIQINKIDSETKKPIQGVKFELKNNEGKTVAKATTDKNGVANFTNLYQGKYKLVETKQNKDYIITQAEFDVDVKYNETTVENIENDHKKGNLKIYKVDKDNNQIGLGNIEFELYSEELQKTIGTYTTNADGEIYIENLRTGKYKLKEKNTNKWYNLIEDAQIEVKWEEEEPITEVTLENELKKGQVKVMKVDKDNNEIKLDGVKFNVLDSNGKILETITTDKNGEALTSKYAVRDYSKLYIQEIETKEQYKLNEKKIEVKLEANKVTTVQVENEVKKGKIKIIKVDRDDNKIKLAGVEFEVYDEQNNLVQTLVTDKNGEAETKNLPANQKYTIRETKTLEDYKLNNEEFIIELQPDETSEIIVENERKQARIRIIKVDEENNDIKLPNVEFNILNSKGEVVDTVKTNNEGEAVTKELLINEEYKIVETKTLENYVLDTDVKTIVLDKDETKEITIKNKKIKGKIKIIKTSKDENIITKQKKGDSIEGVKFEVYNTKNEKVDTVITDESGIAETKELEKGKYYVKEISTNKWYILDNKTYDAEINTNGQIVEINIQNESKKPEVDIEKSGVEKAEVGSTIEYDISVRNTGNTSLNNFNWTDEVPSKYIKVTEFETGTYNQNIKYDLYYKTNLTDNKYVLMMEDLNTTENYKIDFIKELGEDEYITEIKLDFGDVDIGFSSNDNPHIKAIIRDEVKSGDIFTNTAKVSGMLYDYYVKDVSIFKTEAYKILPLTGF